jgi:hypothetical protein
MSTVQAAYPNFADLHPLFVESVSDAPLYLSFWEQAACLSNLFGGFY